MKKTLILALAFMFVLSVFACGGAAQPEPTAEPTAAPTTEVPAEPTPEPAPELKPEDLTGVWMVTDVTANGQELKASDLGIGIYFDFLEDGKNVHSWVRSESMTDDYTMAFDVDGFTIILHDRAGDEYAVYDPETDRISFTSEGTTMYIERAPEATDPSAPVS